MRKRWAGISLADRLDPPEVHRVDGGLPTKLLEQPVEELLSEQRVEPEPGFVERDPLAEGLDLSESGLVHLCDQRRLRQRAGESASIGRFVLQDFFGEAAIDHRVGENKTAAGAQDPEAFGEDTALLRG